MGSLLIRFFLNIEHHFRTIMLLKFIQKRLLQGEPAFHRPDLTALIKNRGHAADAQAQDPPFDPAHADSGLPGPVDRRPVGLHLFTVLAQAREAAKTRWPGEGESETA